MPPIPEGVKPAVPHVPWTTKAAAPTLAQEVIQTELEIAAILDRIEAFAVVASAEGGHTGCVESRPFFECRPHLKAALEKIRESVRKLSERPVAYGHMGQDTTKCRGCTPTKHFAD